MNTLLYAETGIAAIATSNNRLNFKYLILTGVIVSHERPLQ